MTTPTVSPSSQPALIGLDWGTSALRACLFDRNGVVLDQRADNLGIMNIRDGAFRGAFESLCAPWLAATPKLPVIASGMIGSRQGWREAPYAAAPAGFDEIAAGLIALDDAANRCFRVVPGVQYWSPEASATAAQTGAFDVMRGEETQVFGALAMARSAGKPSQTRTPSPPDGLYVLPGTHSKWVKVSADRITGLRTSLTGETFALLSTHSILGRLFDTAADPDTQGAGTPAGAAAFEAGVHQGHAQAGSLLHLLFRVRTEGLFGRLTPQQLPAYLSGLLTGAEIADGWAWQRGAFAPTLIGSPEQTRRYAHALRALDFPVRIAPPDCTAAGLYSIARAAGLIRGHGT